MKKIAKSLFLLLAISFASLSQQSCSSKPEGAFTEEEKVQQDSTDSTSLANDFEALMAKDSLSRDSQNK